MFDVPVRARRGFVRAGSQFTKKAKVSLAAGQHDNCESKSFIDGFLCVAIYLLAVLVLATSNTSIDCTLKGNSLGNTLIAKAPCPS